MKRIAAILLIALLFLFTGCTSSQSDDSSDESWDEDRIAELEYANEELEDRVEELEYQVEELQNTVWNIESYLENSY